MTIFVSALALCALVICLFSGSDSGGDGFTRRACIRLLVLGASGLSFLPDWLLAGRAAADESRPLCYRPPGRRPELEGTPLLARWARLGRIWREMSSHLRGKLDGSLEEQKARFAKLQVETAAALDAVDASLELRAIFGERWLHIERLRYVMATCYMPAIGGPRMVRDVVEQQVSELEQLVAEGKLTVAAARKAAGTLAVQAEYLMRVRKLAIELQGRDDWEAWKPLKKEYDEGKIEPSSSADLAGKRLAELTVDKLGWLAGPPEENEGGTLEESEADTPEEDTEQ